MLSVLMLLAAAATAQHPERQAPKERPTRTKVVLLGTGTPVPDPDRSGPATAIVVGDSAYLVDFGPGVVRRAQSAVLDRGITALEPGNLKVAFVTHLHSDHTAGYSDLIFTGWTSGRSAPLEVYGPPGLNSMTEHILQAYRIDIETRTNPEGNQRVIADGWKVNAHEIRPGVIYKDANVREETVEAEILETFRPLRFSEDERKYFALKVARLREDWNHQKQDQIQGANLKLGQIQDRLARLTDAYIDRMIEKNIFEQRNAALLMERKSLEENLAALRDEAKSLPDRLAEFLELAGDAYSQYKLGLPEEKRDLLKIVTSNRQVAATKVELTLAQPFCELANRFDNSSGAPYRDIPRTWDRLIENLWDFFKLNPTARLSAHSDVSSENSARDKNDKARGLAA